MNWHKFPDELPPEYKELLVAITQLNRINGKDTVIIGHNIASWNYYDGWSLDFAQSAYHAVRYWMEIPKIPPINTEPHVSPPIEIKTVEDMEEHLGFLDK